MQKHELFQGGVDSGFRKRQPSESERRAARDVHLFHIRGTSELNTRAVEVIARAASLNSNDVFLMKTPDKAFIWEGSVRFSSFFYRCCRNNVLVFTLNVRKIGFSIMINSLTLGCQ